jgi:DNA invertase Pin-like site-specific DNA recombinase
MKPKRMDGYVRVSRRLGREGPGYISPDVQREAIARWAEYKGVEIAEVWVDEDESGGTQERPGLEAAVARALAGETGGIVSWKIDRFSRYTEGGLRDLRRLEEADARLAFVVEDVDTSGPMGKFVYTVMLAMSEYFLDNIKAGWKTAKTRAVARGVKIGPTPFGYRRGKDAVLKPDPVTGPIVAETFRLAAREGFESALAHVVEHGAGHRWTTTTLRRLLRNRTYLGEARYGDLVTEDAHPALVSTSVWAAAQPAQEAPRRPRRTYPLSGLARCASCESPLVGTRAGSGVRAYRCSAAARSRRPALETKPCAAPAFATADLLEELVRRTLAERLQDRAYVGGDDPAGALDEAAGALADARRELDDLLGDAGLRRIVGADRFRRLAEDAVAAVEECQAAYEEAARRAERRLRVPAVELLASAELDELGELLRGALEAVVVERGRRPIIERVRIVPRGGAPDEVWTPTPKDAKGGGVETFDGRSG